jgi:hypothetical protein
MLIKLYTAMTSKGKKEPQVRSIEELSRQFNTTTRDLITKIEKKTRDEVTLANLDRAKQRMKLLKDTLGDMALIKEASPFFIDYSEQLLDPNAKSREKFFLDLDIREEAMKRNSNIEASDEFVINLVDSIKEMFRKSSDNEKNDIHAKVKILFDCSLEYQINVQNWQQK